MKEFTDTISSVNLIENLEPGLDKCEISFAFDTHIIFGDYKELLGYVGKEATYTVRKDVVAGRFCTVVNWIAERQKVSYTDAIADLKAAANVSLIPKESNTNFVITFNAVNYTKLGDIAYGAVVLVTDVIKGSSDRAKWYDFVCLDNQSKVFKLRYFGNDLNLEEFCANAVGRYIICDIKSTMYGFQIAGGEVSIISQEVVASPEIKVCKSICEAVLSGDPELAAYDKKYTFIDTLEGLLYFEPGYHLVEMAAELKLIEAVCNISSQYDRKLLNRAVFASRGYLLGSKNGYSNPIMNFTKCIQTELKNDVQLCKLIDICAGVSPEEINKSVYLSIRRLVHSIVRERRGLDAQDDINGVLGAVDTVYNGLFHEKLS